MSTINKPSGGNTSNLASMVKGSGGAVKQEGPTLEELKANVLKEQKETEDAQAKLEAAIENKDFKHSYCTIGEPTFNCIGRGANMINFTGGVYATDSDEEAEALEYFVGTKRIKKV